MKLDSLYHRQTMTITMIAFITVIANTAYFYFVYSDKTPFSLLITSNVIVLACFFLLAILLSAQLKKAETETSLNLRSNPSRISFPTIRNAIEEYIAETQKVIGYMKHQNLTLESQVFQDNLTQLKNRYAFTLDIQNFLEDTSKSELACLAIIRTTELNNINHQRGRVAGDNYIQAIADIIKHISMHFPSSSVYRLSSSDYAILIKDTLPSVGALLGKELKQLFDNYQLQTNLESIAYTGMTFLKNGHEYSNIMARADLALAKAQTGTTNGWVVQLDDATDAFEGELYWKGILQDILQLQSVNFQTKSATLINQSLFAYIEYLPQFHTKEGQLLPRDTVYAMAMRHDLMNEIEKLTIKQFISTVKNNNNINHSRYGLTLSTYSLFKPSFMLWLEQILLSEHMYCSSMVFAFDESSLDCHLNNSLKMFEMLKRVGSRTCINHFGQGIRSFSLYRELVADYIILSANLVENLDRDNTSQQFIRTLVEIAHRLQCIVFADGVSSIIQREILERIYIDGFQGKFDSKAPELTLA